MDTEGLVREIILENELYMMAQSVIAVEKVTIESYGAMDNFCSIGMLDGYIPIPHLRHNRFK